MWIKVPCEFTLDDGPLPLDKLQELGIEVESKEKVSWMVFNTKDIQNYNPSTHGFATLEMRSGFRITVLVSYDVFDRLFRPIDITTGLNAKKRFFLKLKSYLNL